MVEQRVLAQLENWRELLSTNRRQLIREVIGRPIAFTPEGRRYQFAGKTVTGKLIAGLIGDSTLSGVPNGE
jgi:hypothetical protein